MISIDECKKNQGFVKVTLGTLMIKSNKCTAAALVFIHVHA